MAETARFGLTALPALLPINFDESGRRLRCIEMNEDDYRAASFLDERMLERRASCLVPTDDVERLAASLTGESDFIFHIGHVGSTLLSRLLGSGVRCFALREPAVLRALATTAPDERPVALGVMLKLYARVWRSGQRSLVKATSFVAEIAAEVLDLAPTSRAVLMFVAPQVFISGILGGEATRAELPRVTSARLARLAGHVGEGRLSPPSSDGEMAAVGWACEICALARAAGAFPGRVLWFDFDRFLSDPKAGLAAALRHLHGHADPSALASMLASADFGRYSKAPEHAFDAAQRAGILSRSDREHASEIDRGIAWLNAAGAAHPVIAQASRAAAAGRTF